MNGLASLIIYAVCVYEWLQALDLSDGACKSFIEVFGVKIFLSGWSISTCVGQGPQDYQASDVLCINAIIRGFRIADHWRRPNTINRLIGKSHLEHCRI